MFTLFFNPEPVVNNTVAGRCDTKRFARYFRGMLERQVYLPCSQFEANFVSTAHTDADIRATIRAARETLSSLGPG
jgi:glutamate-1-semialdehyde 2,1-aminomutase